MSFVMEEEGNGTRVEFDDEQIKRCHQVLIDACSEKPTTRNSVFFKVSNAVETLDKAGFEWGAKLDDCCKKWGVVWMLRSLTNPRRRRWPKFQPAFIEVF